MHSHLNVRLTNKDQKQGNVANYFERLADLVQVNDGTRSFQLRTVDCHDQAAPFNSSQETRIAITHSDHQISQITDGFLTFQVRLMLQLTGIDPTFADKDHLCKLFVGFKSSNQILDQLQITCRNLSTGYQQNECCREGFAYSTLKPRNEKKTRKYVHSLYENVSIYSPSVCGTYIDIAEFKDGLPHPVEFEINLPFDNILALQAFDLYPNSVCGDLELKFYVNPRGLVWCMVDPMNVKEYKEMMEGDSINLVCDQNMSALFKHSFTQINNATEIINSFTEGASGVEGVPKVTVAKGACNLQCTGMEIRSLKSNMYGFNVTSASLQRIAQLFEAPQVIPSQGARFLQHQLIAGDLSGGLECTKEFEDSIVMAKNTSSGTRYNNCLSDGTSFMWNIQCERNNAGYTYDGIDSQGQNIPIQIRGQPIYSGANDTYYNVDKDGTQHPPPPQIWLCRDTYFLISSQGVVYEAFSTPKE